MTEESLKRRLRGVVLSDKGNKTITVGIERRKLHQKYKKYVKRSTKYYAHDENNTAKVGDMVTIEQTRPLSKLKRWRLVEVHTKSN